MFFYAPSKSGFDIGFEKASYSLEIGAGLGFSLIYKTDNNYKKFDRFAFQGLESSIGGSAGIFNGSLFTASDGSYIGVSAGFVKSKEVFGGKRDNKNVGLSGAKLIEGLSILPGPKKSNYYE